MTVTPGSGLVLGRTIGTGPHGEVRRAEAPDGSAPVAVKILTGLDDAAVARFAAAGAGLTALRSPHLVPVLAVQTMPGGPGEVAIVMTLVPGVDLRQHLDLVGPMAPGLATELTSQVLRALWTVHEAGLTHGGVKPENVLLDLSDDEHPRALLTDVATTGLIRDDVSSPGDDVDAAVRLLAELVAGRPGVGGPADRLLAARPASAEEALAVLDGPGEPAAAPVRPAAPERPAARRLVAVLAVVALAALAGVLLINRPSGGAGATAGSAARGQIGGAAANGAAGNSAVGNGVVGNGVVGNGLAGNGAAGNGAVNGAVGNGLPGNGLPGSGLPGNGAVGNGLPGNGGVGSGGVGSGGVGNGGVGSGGVGNGGVGSGGVGSGGVGGGAVGNGAQPGVPGGPATAAPTPPQPTPTAGTPPPSSLPSPTAPAGGLLTVTVPDVVGLKVGDAITQLDVLGLATVDAGALLGQKKGRKVTAQSPAAGTRVLITQPVSLSTAKQD